MPHLLTTSHRTYLPRTDSQRLLPPACILFASSCFPRKYFGRFLSFAVRQNADTPPNVSFPRGAYLQNAYWLLMRPGTDTAAARTV